MQTIAGCMMALLGLALRYASDYDERTMSLRDYPMEGCLSLIGAAFVSLGVLTAVAGWGGWDWNVV